MTTLSIAGASWAHGVHYSVLGIGMLGLLRLLGPHVLASLGARSSTRDVHELRVRALRRQLASVGAGSGVGPGGLIVSAPQRGEQVPTAPALWVPLVVVSTVAAAGVHAAVGPAHLREQLVFGAFFLACAVGQLAMALALVRPPRRGVLLAGALANAGVVLLWASSRTVGLPGLLSAPEPVGAWDLASVVWELVVIAGCLQLLGRPGTRALPEWGGWHSLARAWAWISVFALMVLTLSGAGS